MDECKTYVYRLYDAVGNLLYIGCSKNVNRRISKHKATPWGIHIDRVLEVEYSTRAEALKHEGKAIMSEAPCFNAAHNWGESVRTPHTPNYQYRPVPRLPALGYVPPPSLDEARKVKHQKKRRPRKLAQADRE
jgi:predicted GIY-YIG superfamily endonuclease